jgi:hypothetical protein
MAIAKGLSPDLDSLRRQLGDALFEARHPIRRAPHAIQHRRRCNSRWAARLYAGFEIEALSVRRKIGGRQERRGRAAEIVVRNYSGKRGLLPGLCDRRA